MPRPVALTCIKAVGRAWPMIDVWTIQTGAHDMALGLADPFDALLRFQRALEQRLDSDWLENATSGVGAFPPINVFQQGSDFVVIIEMPGIHKDSLGLEVRGNALRISGKKTIDYGSNASVHRRDRVAAEYRNGVLALSLPRTESDKPKAIRIN